MSTSQWRLIETAPQDNTRILAWCMSRGVFIAAWTSRSAHMSQGEVEDWGISDDWIFQKAWFAVGPNDNKMLVGSEKPTHWMPIPDMTET